MVVESDVLLKRIKKQVGRRIKSKVSHELSVQ